VAHGRGTGRMRVGGGGKRERKKERDLVSINCKQVLQIYKYVQVAECRQI
jgi:hypothetical protein